MQEQRLISVEYGTPPSDETDMLDRRQRMTNGEP